MVNMSSATENLVDDRFAGFGVGQNYASRSDRLLGQIADGLIGGVPLLVGALLAYITNGLAATVMGVGVIWSAFYYLFADGFSHGQSFGKRWLGIHCVSEQTGRPCSFGQSFARNFLLAALGPIDWIFIFGEKHQRLGDKLAGTIVVTD
jgi:uncharacterized RDD family membrane protein YckC